MEPATNFLQNESFITEYFRTGLNYIQRDLLRRKYSSYFHKTKYI